MDRVSHFRYLVAATVGTRLLLLLVLSLASASCYWILLAGNLVSASLFLSTVLSRVSSFYQWSLVVFLNGVSSTGDSCCLVCSTGAAFCLVI